MLKIKFIQLPNGQVKVNAVNGYTFQDASIAYEVYKFCQELANIVNLFSVQWIRHNSMK